MYRQIDSSLLQRTLYLRNKNAIATNLSERNMRNLIARGANLLDCDLKIGPLLAQSLDYPVCLYHCELACSRPYRNALHSAFPNQTNSALPAHTHAPRQQPPHLSIATLAHVKIYS